jgi:hypothetical protein
MARRCARSTSVAILVIAMVLRALTPGGYMPGSLADGTPYVLCPYSTPGAGYFLSRSQGAHSYQHNHSQADTDNSADRPWEFCPLGAAFAAAAPAYDEAVPAISVDGTYLTATTPRVRLAKPPRRTVWARGPPALAS